MAARSSLSRSNRPQAVRLPKDIAFPDGVKQVAVWREGHRRVLAPADAMWDDVFMAASLDLPERDQPAAQDREVF